MLSTRGVDGPLSTYSPPNALSANTQLTIDTPPAFRVLACIRDANLYCTRSRSTVAPSLIVMPYQSPATPLLSPSPLVSPPAESSRHDVNTAGACSVPSATSVP